MCVRAVTDDLTYRLARLSLVRLSLLRIAEGGMNNNRRVLQSEIRIPQSSGGLFAALLLADLFDDDCQVARHG